MFRLRNIQKYKHLTKRFYSTDTAYNPWETIGTHKDPPNHAIWINKTYKFGNLLYAIQYLIDDYRFGEKGVEKKVEDHFEKNGFKVLSVVSRLKEDGCFVYFESLETAEKALQYIRDNPINNSSTSYLVMGTPFIEDLLMKRPTIKIGVDLPIEMSQEQLFEIFRPYGRMSRIILDEKLKKAEILYWKKSSSIAARNCLHNSSLSDTHKLYLKYMSHTRFQKIYEIFQSPKMLPIIAILLTITLYLLVEPIRLFSVTQTILFTGEKDKNLVIPEIPFEQRKIDIEEIKSLLSEHPESLLLIQGPVGAGKASVLKHVVQERKLCIRIDCSRESSLVGQGDANTFIDDIERTVGYFPTFSSVTNILSYFETFLPMKKQALSSTKQTQLYNVLTTIETALKIIGMRNVRENLMKFQHPVIIFDGFQDLIQKLDNQSKEEREKGKILIDLLMKWSMNNVLNKRAHIVFVCNDSSFTEEAFREYPNMRGRIVNYYIDDIEKKEVTNYLNSTIYIPESKDIKEQVKEVKPAQDFDIQNHESSKIQILWNILTFRRGSQPIDTTVKEKETLTNITEEKPQNDKKQNIIEEAVSVIGGRISDINSLCQRVNRGFTVKESIDDMISEAKDEILYGGFGEKLFIEETGKKWTQSQLWRTIKLIAEKEKVPYETLLFQVFEGNQASLDSLISSDLLSTKEKDILAHSPLYLSTFKKITTDKSIIKGMEKLCAQVNIDKTKKKIHDIEDEMVKINKSGVSQDSFRKRKEFLEQKLGDLNESLIVFEEQEMFYSKMKV